MCIALIGSIGRSEWSWREAAARAGFDLWMSRGPEVSVATAIRELEALVIMSDGVSREGIKGAMKIAEDKGIPALCVSCEGAVLCGVVSGAGGRTSCLCRADKDLQPARL